MSHFNSFWPCSASSRSMCARKREWTFSNSRSGSMFTWISVTGTPPVTGQQPAALASTFLQLQSANQSINLSATCCTGLHVLTAAITNQSINRSATCCTGLHVLTAAISQSSNLSATCCTGLHILTAVISQSINLSATAINQWASQCPVLWQWQSHVCQLVTCQHLQCLSSYYLLHCIT